MPRAKSHFEKNCISRTFSKDHWGRKLEPVWKIRSIKDPYQVGHLVQDQPFIAEPGNFMSDPCVQYPWVTQRPGPAIHCWAGYLYAWSLCAVFLGDTKTRTSHSLLGRVSLCLIPVCSIPGWHQDNDQPFIAGQGIFMFVSPLISYLPSFRCLPSAPRCVVTGHLH